MDHKTYLNLSPKEMHEIFKKQHIVVNDFPCKQTEFDEKAMAVLANPFKPITIHGKSIMFSFHLYLLTKSDLSVLPRSHDGDERHVIGVTGDLLRSHRSKKGKILNALDFPMPTRGPHPLESIATDILAFNETLDDPNCRRTDRFPLSDLYWGLIALAHAFHYFHIDADGFATFIAPQTGAKFWLFARLKAGRSFSETGLYVGGTYAIDQMNLDMWDVEAILLTPGTCL